MAVNLNQEGQTVLEIVFILPLLFLFVAMLYKINMAAQMAINNTQYARSQIYILTSNSPEYPRLGFRMTGSTIFGDHDEDRMVLGVTAPSALDSANRNDATFEPVPQTQKIARSGTTVRGSTDRGEVRLRNEIRVRNTSAICTQLNSIGKGVMNSDNILALGSERWPFRMPVCRYQGTGDGPSREGD